MKTSDIQRIVYAWFARRWFTGGSLRFAYDSDIRNASE